MALEPDDHEIRPVAGLHRSRLAFALAVTLAAVPVVVVDNLSATAETNQARVEVTSSSEPSNSTAPSTTVTPVPPTTTTAAPSTTAAAPSTTGGGDAPVANEVVAVQAVSPAAVVEAPTAPPTTAPPPPPSTTVAPRPYGDPSDIATWDRMAQCESGGNWAMNTGNGYYGGLQFSVATWRNVGGTGYPHQASKAEQVKRGQILQARAGWGQWPHCAGQLGLL